MRERPVEILLVEDDADLAAMAERCLQDAVTANVTIVSTAAEALREELTGPCDLLIVEADLADGRGLDLVREMGTAGRRPVVLLADAPGVEDLLEAMQAGVREVLIKPIDWIRLVDAVQQAAHRIRRQARRRTRQRRLRRLASRIIRERRDLRQRIDLLCRDFVHAYRRLAQRVADSNLLSSRR